MALGARPCSPPERRPRTAQMAPSAQAAGRVADRAACARTLAKPSTERVAFRGTTWPRARGRSGGRAAILIRGLQPSSGPGEAVLRLDRRRGQLACAARSRDRASRLLSPGHSARERASSSRRAGPSQRSRRTVSSRFARKRLLGSRAGLGIGAELTGARDVRAILSELLRAIERSVRALEQARRRVAVEELGDASGEAQPLVVWTERGPRIELCTRRKSCSPSSAVTPA